MAVTLACIGGRDADSLLQSGKFAADRIGPRETPFGPSQPIFRCHSPAGEFFFLSRHGETRYERTPSFVNYRANIYALKDLGTQRIISWSEVRAISHNFKIGQYVIVDDVVDETSRRQTFFQDQGFGHLRQWPVFCPALGEALKTTLAAEKCEFAARGVYVCVEGPRHETPAETRKYAVYGGELLGQALAPEVFLAKELELCYASLCYVGRYAEDGTNYRPFEDGRVLPEEVERRRATIAVDRMPRLLEHLCISPFPEAACTCRTSMESYIGAGQLPRDWHGWFHSVEPNGRGDTRPR